MSFSAFRYNLLLVLPKVPAMASVLALSFLSRPNHWVVGSCRFLEPYCEIRLLGSDKQFASKFPSSSHVLSLSFEFLVSEVRTTIVCGYLFMLLRLGG